MNSLTLKELTFLAKQQDIPIKQRKAFFLKKGVGRPFYRSVNKTKKQLLKSFADRFGNKELFLRGAGGVTFMTSGNHEPRKILLIGDQHTKEYANCNASHDKVIDVKDYLANLFESFPELTFDLFIEADYRKLNEQRVIPEPSFLEDTIKRFSCFLKTKKTRCEFPNLHGHYADIRSIFPEEMILYPDEKVSQMLKTETLNEIFSWRFRTMMDTDFLRVNELIRKQLAKVNDRRVSQLLNKEMGDMQQVFKEIFEIWEKTAALALREGVIEFKQDTLEFSDAERRLRSKVVDIGNMLFDGFATLMDLYLLGRMFGLRNLTQDLETRISTPRHSDLCVIVAGGWHIDNYTVFLSQLGYQIQFQKNVESLYEGEIGFQCTDVSDLNLGLVGA